MSKLLYLGSRDQEIVSLVQTILKERTDITISVLDKPDLNVMDDRSKAKVIEWKEKEKMSNFIRVPANIEAAIKKGEDLYRMIKEAKAIERFHQILSENNQDIDSMSNVQVEAIKEESNKWDGWFRLKDAVEATTLSYSQARELTDLLYAFGFIAQREVEKQTFYTILLNDDMKVDYINLLIKENEDNIKALQNAVKSIKSNSKPVPVKKNRAKKVKVEEIVEEK